LDDEKYLINDNYDTKEGDFFSKAYGSAITDSGNFNLYIECLDQDDNPVDTTINWNIPFGNITSTPITPDQNVTRYSLFDFKVRFNCTGAECGDVNTNLTLRNDSTQNITVPTSYAAGYPFFTTDNNPQTKVDDTCLEALKAGEYCDLTWKVNATWPSDSSWLLFGTAYSTDYSNVNYEVSSSTNLTIITDATPPNATIRILSYEGIESFTNSRIVTLELSYSDDIAVDKCRYASDSALTINDTVNNTLPGNYSDWESCTSVKEWVLNSLQGNRTAFYQVKDIYGNIGSANDTIEYRAVAGPTAPIVYDGTSSDIDWQSSNTSLSSNWFNSTDALYPTIYYEYKIYENGTCFTGYCSWIGTNTNTYVTVSNVNLTEGNNYTFEVRARNAKYIYSSTSFSDGVVVDITSPNMTMLNSTTHPEQNTTYAINDVTFIWNATDPVSGNVASNISGYSYSIDSTNNTIPDNTTETASNNVTLTDVADGTWYFHVKAVDNAGNPSTPLHYKVIIETAGASITLTQPTSPTSETSINVSGTVNKNSTVILYVNSVNVSTQNVSGTGATIGFTFTDVNLSTNSINSIYATATDASNITTTSNTVYVLQGVSANITAVDLKVEYTGLSGGTSQNRMKYVSDAAGIIGVATESDNLSLTTDFVANVAEKPVLLFITSSSATPADVDDELEDQEFFNLLLPNFAGRSFKSPDNYYLGTQLNYDDIAIQGDQDVGVGRFTLIIENKGLDDEGRPIVEVRII